MRHLFLCVLLFVVIPYIPVQAQIIGRYVDKNSGDFFDFDCKNYVFVTHYYGYTDTISSGCFKNLDDGCIELSYVESPCVKSMKETRVNQKRVTALYSDSIALYWTIPTRKKLQIVVAYRRESNPNILIEKQICYNAKKNTVCYIESDATKFSYTIRPVDILPHTAEGLFWGLVEICSVDYLVQPNINYIQIEIPTITNDFFEKIYMQNELVKIAGDTLYWRGNTYKKEY